ncbi:MAG TPA: LysR family transcriptional regulator [Chloroflexota bacterium]|nr:LysR family transcriptional regulator [Chloroflexota bacterium]
MLQLQHLRTFYEVATSGSFTRAAERLYLSQPAVTQQVRALEAELGFPLLERLGRRVRLTPAGEALLPYVLRLLALLEEAASAAREAAGRAALTLRVGAGDTVGTYVLPDLIRTFHTRRPEAALRLVVGNSDRLLDAVLEDEVEIAIWARQEPHHLLTQRTFWRVPLVVVLQPDDPLASRPRVWARELQGRRLLLRGRASAIRRFIDGILQRAGVEENEIIEMDHLEAIKRTVETGYGVTVAPAFAVSREVALGTLAAPPLADPGSELPLYYVHYAHRRLSPLAQLFIELLIGFAESAHGAVDGTPGERQ